MEQTMWTKASCHGDLFTREGFALAVHEGTLIDYDGSGEYARLQGTEEALRELSFLLTTIAPWDTQGHCMRLGIEIEVHGGLNPSELEEVDFRWPSGCTHVLWFNK